MRCKICDQLLNEWETVRKDPETKEYLDTCTHCIVMSRPETIDKMEEEDGYLSDFKPSDNNYSVNLVD